jgi:hydroxymethylbilane synthase
MKSEKKSLLKESNLLKKLLESSLDNPITVGARSSNLSKAQADEVLKELRKFYPWVEFQTTYLETQGDIDQQTSLRTLEKTNFFTKEIDELVLNGKCRIGIHSAKDLPDPLPKGLSLAAVTRGVDSSDALVMRPGVSINTLPSGAWIATSSFRREEMVKELRADLRFKDIRGPIEHRLAQLETGEADGIVIAEAALIRLGLTYLNRIKLPGNTIPLQGQLAIITRFDDEEMHRLFACIDKRG